MLLIGVAALATTAKNGQYFPQSSAAHRVSISTKLNLVHAGAVYANEWMQPAATAAPSILSLPTLQPEPLVPAAVIRQISTSVSVRHRSPPASYPRRLISEPASS
jgi:hypothetical protein